VERAAIGYLFKTMEQETRIRVFRGEHQFAAAHFLVEMGKCERLHGHNYSVMVELGGGPGADHTLIDFNTLNPAIGRICESLDHKIIIAGNDQRIDLTIGATEVEAKFKGKRYIFPMADCAILDIEATTVERLAEYILNLLAKELSPRENIRWIEVGVREGLAQMAIRRRDLR